MSKKTPILFKILKRIIFIFYPKMKSVGLNNLPDEPCIIVGNHSQTNGPICSELYMDFNHLTWCRGEMMHLKEVPKYAFWDFWRFKPKYTHPFYKVLSYIIAPLSVFIFKNAKTIAVYNDTRALSTFKNTMEGLKSGVNIVIFPEHNLVHNHILYDFQDKFVDSARLYYKKTGKCVAFVPLYIAPKLKCMYFGEPTYFNPDADPLAERQRIKNYLMEQITDIAVNLPEHTVVPYRNIPKKDYPKNTAKKGDDAINAKTCSKL